LGKLGEGLEELEFELFCEMEDLGMARKEVARIEELKRDEDNYKELKGVEERFGVSANRLRNDKLRSEVMMRERLQ
jgi:hypothetical protein